MSVRRMSIDMIFASPGVYRRVTSEMIERRNVVLPVLPSPNRYRCDSARC